MLLKEALVLADAGYTSRSGSLGPPEHSRLKAIMLLRDFPHTCKHFMTAFIPMRLALGGEGTTWAMHPKVGNALCVMPLGKFSWRMQSIDGGDSILELVQNLLPLHASSQRP